MSYLDIKNMMSMRDPSMKNVIYRLNNRFYQSYTVD